jgi:tetratricopeptide (TPR) repeat protein
VRDATPRTYVFWVHASTRARFEEAYRGLADRLELPGRLDPKADVLRLVSDWLCNEANGKWTMVVDNVDDVETFFPLQRRDQGGDGQETSKPLTAYLPQSRNGSILITSRSRDAAARLVGGHKNIREVLAMNESQGLQLLYNKLLDPSHEEGVAIELLRTLDCMPLAITQAAAYINRRSHLTISDYLDEFHANDKRRESLLNWDAGDLRRDESASNSVVTAWQISFERIRHERPSAAELLSLMSFFNPQGIPEKTLRRYSKTTAQAGVLGIEGETSRTIDEDFDTLHAFSLITVTTSTAGDIMWGMHALVQFCTRVWLSSYGEVERWKSAFLELLAKDFPIGEYENWKKCQQLLPHVEPLYDSELDSEQLLAAWAQVLTNAAWYLLRKGTYQTAQIVATKAVRARERVFGPEDERTMTSITVLAILLHHQGKYEEAEKLDRRALKGRERQLGAHHPSTLRSVENLASVLRAQGKYEESVKLNRRALKGYENELGGYYRDMLTCMKNLAAVLQDQGKYVEAEKLTRQALEGREKELGVYHPDTLTSVSDLALVLKVQGKYEEAEKLNRQALEGYEKELGSYHPDTLTSVNNLASVLQDQGHHDEAEKLNLRALEGRNQELGPYHPETLMSMNNLASVLQNQGKYDEAEKLNRQALEGCEKELGLNHPKTLVSVDYLALVLCRQGRYEEAEKLNRRAIAGYEKELGVHHPHTLTSLNNLALVLQDQGKYSEAEKINRRALEGSEKELGPHHPDTLNSTHCLAGLLRRLRQYDEAAKLYKRAYDGLIQEFGPQHPRTIACREDFSALQQEAKQAALDGKQPPLRGKDTIANNSPSEIAFARAGSKQKDKQESILARVKRRIRGRD